MNYDVIVLGLGGMGSSAAYHLARRGQRVLGLEQFTPGHDRGSSHGYSRVIRQAYFEDPAYVPLLLRAYELWAELEAASGENLLTITGGLMMGTPESDTVAGSLRSAREHGLPHELLDADEIRRRFPPFRPLEGEVGLYEAAAGYLRPERAVRAHLAEAEKLGADLRFGERVLDWSDSGDSVTVRTENGNYSAAKLVISAGAWARGLIPKAQLVPERQVMFWIKPDGPIEPFLPDRFPVFIYRHGESEQVYGMPSQVRDGGPDGVKVAFYRQPDPCDPDALNREVSLGEVERIRTAIVTRIPSLAGPLVEARACLYTMSPDQHFVVGLHPEHERVVVASPCSGHGFKFCSVMGEILADLAEDGKTDHPIGLFDPRRIFS